MRHAFIADIHGNYDALEAVLAEIDRSEPDAVYCLGDIVGYGAEPLRCVDAIRERAIPCVVGNHDLAVADALTTDYFNAAAKESVRWTREKLGADEIGFLCSFPLQRECESFTVLHGALPNPAAFDYILTTRDAALSFAALKHRCAFTAHTHIPITFLANKDDVTGMMLESVALPEGNRALFNVGSVGQPRDGMPLATFATFDSEEARLSIVRVSYDVEEAAQKILDVGLPSMNAYRLLLGR